MFSVKILIIFLAGVTSECQQERSQIRNKEKAMQMLCAKLYNIKLEEENKKRNSARKIQVSFILGSFNSIWAYVFGG